MADVSYNRIVVRAGTEQRQSITGRMLNVFSSSGEFDLMLSDGDKMGPLRRYRQKNAQFDVATFINESAEDIIIKYFYGDGEVDVDTIALTGGVEIDGEVEIVNKEGQILNVYDDEINDQFTRLFQILQSEGSRANTLSKGTTFKGENSAFFDYVTGLQTILTPAVNTNGVLIRNNTLTGNSYVSLFADTSAPTGYNDTTKHIIGTTYAAPDKIETPNLLIPAGQGLYVAPFSYVFGHIEYDIL